MFEIVEHRGPQAGPTVALLAGIHGDEDEGVLGVQRIEALLQESPPLRGVVRSVAVAHPAAYAANRRTSPLDGRNLARCFPGDPAGTATERLAHALTDRVIRGSDILIDLHSAGREYAMPTYVGYVESADHVGACARHAAEAFAAPLIWAHPAPVPAGRTLSAAAALGIPGIYVEGSGGGSLELDELEIFVSGVHRVLADLGLLPNAPPGLTRQIVRGGIGDLDAGMAARLDGRFVAARRPGDVLAAGDRIGEIFGEAGEVIDTIRTEVDATIMFLRRATRVFRGDVLCSLAPPAEPWTAR